MSCFVGHPACHEINFAVFFINLVIVSSDKVEELLRGLRDAKDQKGSVAILEDTVSKTMKKVRKDFFKRRRE